MLTAIMGAMPDEVDQLAALLENCRTETYAGVEYVQGEMEGKPVVLCCAGMGKANAASTVQVLASRYGAHRLIFSGIAGNMSSEIGVGDVVIGKVVVYHDAEPDMICQIAPFLKEFAGDPALIAAAEEACRTLGIHFLTGKIATGDQFMADRKKIEAIAEQFHAMACEMEGGSIGQVCYMNKTPFAILRAISDNGNDDAVLDYPKFAQQAADRSVALLTGALPLLDEAF